MGSPNILGLQALLCAYQQGSQWLDALRDYLQENLQHIKKRLTEELPEIGYRIPDATYLAWLDLRPLELDMKKLQQQMIHHEKVVIMPGETYGPEGLGFLRLNAGCPRAKLDDGLNRLVRAVQAVRSKSMSPSPQSSD
ncbi:aminotransferase class I/II-fold pyridoxal phosphate-dependent enzyme [Dongshaea marina]|uniref:aminotransferase class I/II-fold pyridoxal phosphate-dependent enzyme n=1 Tax=Dongshaea marina TaxID=2047966 RepID=UPI002D7671C1|nr:aminotransferase class I/II-fold pyridoxal phosphate-dependent enzyme [Dongshaea marina]